MLLRNMGIAMNPLKTDGEVVDLWNGMSRDVRLTKVSSLDKVIDDVNRYYSSRWKVTSLTFRLLMKSYAFCSWQLLTFLDIILLLLLSTLTGILHSLQLCSLVRC